MSKDLAEAVRLSRASAIDLGHATIGVDDLAIGILGTEESNVHQLLGVTHSHTVSIRDEIGLNPDPRSTEDMSADTASPLTLGGTIRLTLTAENTMQAAFEEASRCNSSLPHSEHLLLAILNNREHPTTQVFTRFGITYESLNRAIGSQKM